MSLFETATRRMDEELDARGWSVLPGLLTPAQCDTLTALYDREDEALFRKRVVMQRHGYGQGEYRYFAYPLPAPVQTLRTDLYAQLARPRMQSRATVVPLGKGDAVVFAVQHRPSPGARTDREVGEKLSERLQGQGAERSRTYVHLSNCDRRLAAFPAIYRHPLKGVVLQNRTYPEGAQKPRRWLQS